MSYQESPYYPVARYKFITAAHYVMTWFSDVMGCTWLYEYFILTSEAPFKSAKVSDRKTVKIFIF